MENATEQVKMTWAELATYLLKEGHLDLKDRQSLTIHQIDMNDLISIVEEAEPTKKLHLFVEILKRFGIEPGFEGSLNFGSCSLADRSWTITPGNTHFVRLMAKPLTVRKNVSELVSFLRKLPIGQAVLLEPEQRLFVEDLSGNALISYYQTYQGSKDPLVLEQEQDELFVSSCEELAAENLLLKVYGMHVTQINRNIDMHAEGLLFVPIGSEDNKEPRLVVGLVAKET